VLLEKRDLADLKKAKVSECVAATDKVLIEGGDEELNLLHTLSSIRTILTE